MTGRPLCKNSLCMIDSRAQHKVYEPIRTSVRLHAGGWHTRAGHRFFPSVVAEHALLTARADRAAGRCTILCWYRIDHSTSLAQRRSVREESEADPAWPSVASPLRMDLPDLETHVPAELQRVTRFASDQNGRTETVSVRAPIWSARSCRAGGSRGRYTRTIASRRIRRAQNKFPPDPLLMTE